MDVRAETLQERKGTRMEFLSHKGTITSGNVAKWAGGQVGNHADNGGNYTAK